MAIIREDNGDARPDAGTQYTISIGDVFQGTMEQQRDSVFIDLSGQGGGTIVVSVFNIANLDASDFIF